MSTEVAEETQGLSAELTSEIDAGIDDIIESQNKKDLGSEAESSSSDDAPAPDDVETEDPAPPAPKVSKELAERAGKLGISDDEAKQFPPSLLEKFVSKLEAKHQAGSQGAGEKKSASETNAPPGEDMLSGVPDLDPFEYDDKIVQGFRVMKDVIRQQQQLISELKGSGQKDWIDRKLQGNDLVVGDEAKQAEVRDKFDVLKAGYKAAGREVGDDLIFDEASKLVLGDAMAQAQLDNKTKAAEKRSRHRIARGSGHRADSKGDPLAEVAAEIDARFFK